MSKPPPAISGRNFIKMMRPILGLEGVPSIRSINIVANYNDVALVDVGMVARPDFDRVEVELAETDQPEILTRRYTVTVTEILD